MGSGGCALAGNRFAGAAGGHPVLVVPACAGAGTAEGPRPVLARVRCPVLALNGTLDLQVWHEQNLPEIERAITGAGGDVTVRRYEGLNHLFQPATTGSIGEYGVIETTIDEAVLQDIAAWIELKAGS